ncbi:MAG: multidrug efflux SMR transporter [Oligoflexales bacterium]|nr:multidrug efflux SMR transporter [Oligoflexales bacterium]
MGELSSVGTAWIALILAGIFEIGWPVGLKIAQAGSYRIWGILLAVITMAGSGLFLWFAQKTIPMGTAYAVWTGIGAAGTFILGLILYGEPYSLLRIFGVLLIISGVVVLKLAH